MLFAALILVLLMTVPVSLMYMACEQGGRERWRQVVSGHVASGPAAPFREPTLVPEHYRQAPRAIRLAAYSCLFLGQMFVPGLIAAAIGVFAYGAGLVGIPGLIVAARLFGVGMDLLDHRAGTVERARRATRLAKQLNYTLLVLCGVAGLWLSVAGEWHTWATFWLVNVGYVGISLAQAEVLTRVVQRHEAQLETHRAAAPTVVSQVAA